MVFEHLPIPLSSFQMPENGAMLDAALNVERT
jgi:hypothetical protein